MSEGKRTQVILLDGKTVDLLVQPKLLASDLLDLVVSYISLKEKDFFGLAFLDDTNHFNWLQQDKKVLEHELPRKNDVLMLYFKIQFFPDCIAKLRDSVTIELFYLQAKASVFKCDIEVDSETAFELAAYVLQAIAGDFKSEIKAKEELKKLPVLPQSTLKEHPSLSYCEDRVLSHYKHFTGLSRGQSIICYLQIVEGLPTYGIHYYEVKDKASIPWWLGLSHKGIGQYDQTDRVTPRKVFQWKQLQNIYYKDRKFSIEVIDPRRFTSGETHISLWLFLRENPEKKRVTQSVSSVDLYREAIQDRKDSFDELTDALIDPTTQVSVSRRTFGAGNVTVHAWYGHPVMVRSMWTMAVSQHQFYLDRKHSKEMPATDRTLNEIARDLNKSTVSLTSSHTSDMSSEGRIHGSNPSLKGSQSSLSKLKENSSSRDLLVKAGEEGKNEMIEALKAQRANLEERLKEKLEKLKEICLKEAELTAVLPPEYPVTPGEPVPKIKRRMTTAFTLSEKLVNSVHNNSSSVSGDITRLEREYEILSNITVAARKLANDPMISKKVRRTRRENYKKSALKLSKIEKQLNELRSELGLKPVSPIAPDEVREDIENMETPPRKFSFSSSTLPRKIGTERGRSKTKEGMLDKTRSKSVPRQIFVGLKSPALTRTGSQGIIALEQSAESRHLEMKRGSVPDLSKMTIRDKLPLFPFQQKSNEKTQKGETSSGSREKSDMSRTYQKRTNSEFSVHVKSSRNKTSPHIYQSLQRIPKNAKSGGNSIENFRVRSVSNNSLETPSRVGNGEACIHSHRMVNPQVAYESAPQSPPPVYGTVPKSYIQTGKYQESPEMLPPNHEVKSKQLHLRKHASSMHDLQEALQRKDFPSFDEDEAEYHQQPTTLSQPPTPKKHGSVGNLLHTPGNGAVKDDLELGHHHYYRDEMYRQTSYEMSRGPKPVDYSYILPNYDNTYRSRQDQVPFFGDDGPPVGRRRHHSFSSQHSSSSHSSHTSHQSHGSHQSLNSYQSHLSQSSHRSQRSRGHPGGMAANNGHGSPHSTPTKQVHSSRGYSTQNSSHYSEHTDGGAYVGEYSQYQTPEHSYSSVTYSRSEQYPVRERPPFDRTFSPDDYEYSVEYNPINYDHERKYNQNHGEAYDDEDHYYREPRTYNVYPSEEDYGYHDESPSPDPSLVYPTYTTQQSYSHSGLTVRTVPTQNISPSQTPQPADVYRTSAPVPTRAPHPPVYGTTIAVSKVHYQPATPMTCEPVTKKKTSKANRRLRRGRSVSDLFMKTVYPAVAHLLQGDPPDNKKKDDNFLATTRVSDMSPSSSEQDLQYCVPYGDGAYHIDEDTGSTRDSCVDESSSCCSDHEQTRPVRNPKTRTGTLV